MIADQEREKERKRDAKIDALLSKFGEPILAASTKSIDNYDDVQVVRNYRALCELKDMKRVGATINGDDVQIVRPFDPKSLKVKVWDATPEVGKVSPTPSLQQSLDRVMKEDYVVLSKDSKDDKDPDGQKRARSLPRTVLK